MEELLRGTGRTTRMMRDAVRYSQNGYKVFVVVHSHDFIYHLKKVVESTENITFCVWNLDNYPVDSIRGFNDSIMLVDHYVLERFLNCTQSGHSIFFTQEFINFINKQREIKSIFEKYKNIVKIINQ